MVVYGYNSDSLTTVTYVASVVTVTTVTTVTTVSIVDFICILWHYFLSNTYPVSH